MLTEDDVITIATVRRWVARDQIAIETVILGILEGTLSYPKDNGGIISRKTRAYYGIRNHSSMQVAQLVLTVQETLAAGDGILARLRDPSST